MIWAKQLHDKLNTFTMICTFFQTMEREFYLNKVQKIQIYTFYNLCYVLGCLVLETNNDIKLHPSYGVMVGMVC